MDRPAARALEVTGGPPEHTDRRVPRVSPVLVWTVETDCPESRALTGFMAGMVWTVCRGWTVCPALRAFPARTVRTAPREGLGHVVQLDLRESEDCRDLEAERVRTGDMERPAVQASAPGWSREAEARAAPRRRGCYCRPALATAVWGE